MSKLNTQQKYLHEYLVSIDSDTLKEDEIKWLNMLDRLHISRQRRTESRLRWRIIAEEYHRIMNDHDTMDTWSSQELKFMNGYDRENFDAIPMIPKPPKYRVYRTAKGIWGFGFGGDRNGYHVQFLFWVLTTEVE